MSVIEEKTKGMILSTKPKLKSIQDSIPDIIINNYKLDCNRTDKLLGVHIDNTFTWHTHVDKLIKKCNSLLYLLCRIKKFLSVPSRKLFLQCLHFTTHWLLFCCLGKLQQWIIKQHFKISKKSCKNNTGQRYWYTIIWLIPRTELVKNSRQDNISESSIDV